MNEQLQFKQPLDKKTLFKVEKHIGSIYVLYKEYRGGYPFKQYIINHLYELRKLFTDEKRLQIVRNEEYCMSKNNSINIDKLIGLLK